MSGLDILLVTLAMTILHGKNQFSVSILPFCLCCMAQSQMMHWLGAFVLLCSLCFLLLNFSQWLSDKVLLVTLNMSIQLSLFGSNCSKALGQDSAICVSLEHGSDYSYYISSEQKWQKMLGHCFSLNCQKYLKNSGTHWEFFNPHASVWKPSFDREIINFFEGVHTWICHFAAIFAL